MTQTRQTWLGKYLDFTSDNEAPELFHLFCGITILSHVLGRNSWLDRGHSMIYPGQMYTFLIGPPSIKKSTAARISYRLLHQIPSIRFAAGKLSPSTLIDSMKKHQLMQQNGSGKIEYIDTPSVVFIEASELAVFMPKANYVEELIPLLTKFADAEDEPFHYKTWAHGEMDVFKPLITMLACSTPDWLFKNIPENAWGGGFFSRVLLIHQESSPRVFPNPKPLTLRQLRLQKELVAELMWVNENLAGPILRSNPANDWYERWYLNYHYKMQTSSITGPMAAYLARRPDHLLRLSILIAVSRSRRLFITHEDMQIADELLSRVEKNLGPLLGSRSVSTFSDQTNTVLGFLNKNHKHWHLYADIVKITWQLGIQRPVLTAILETLEMADMILIQEQGGKKYYRGKESAPAN